jgi:cytochrome P450
LAHWAKLEADPSLLPTAVEEMLRHVSPGYPFMRTATKDTELRGVRVKKGERAAMFYPSANRDETHSPIPTVSTSPERPIRTWRSAVAERISA